MTIDDSAGRKAVRDRRSPLRSGPSIFSPQSPTSSRADAPRPVRLRDDVHARALDAAKKLAASRPKAGSE
ncbi:MAG: hypothetical protein AB7O56_14985 [Bauldia sp.]